VRVGGSSGDRAAEVLPLRVLAAAAGTGSVVPPAGVVVPRTTAAARARGGRPRTGMGT
jgi:hypothetical protein